MHLPTKPPPPIVLSIAGSDPGGGAGIQGDIKAIHANGAYALSVVTAITAQNTIETTDVFDLPLHIIQAQLKAIFDDFEVAAIKTGMLASKEIVECVADVLKQQMPMPLILDPVMMSTSGYPLLKPDATQTLKKNLIPLASLLTPNIAEAEFLAEMKITSRSEAESAAKAIHQLGCGAVLLKGGHLSEAPGCDLLYDGVTLTWFEGRLINTLHTHGTGCTYASAIAANLARNRTLQEAVADAKHYVTEAIRYGLNIGQGHGPVNQLYLIEVPPP